MTTTFMIAAHSDPAMLQSLVRSLKSADSRFLVHIDAKVDAKPFQDIFDPNEVIFTSWRIPVWWADYGLCRVALRMLTDSLADQTPSRFFFMSGADYPIKPLEQILNVDTARDLIRIDRLLDEKSDDWFSQTAFRYHFLSGQAVNYRTAHPKVRRLISALSTRLRRKPPSFPVYQGPSWWSLSRATAEAVVALSLDRPEILSWFRWSCLPEELLFQTLVKQIPSANISQDRTRADAPTERESYHATHYVDFKGPSPKVLTTVDLPTIIKSEALFARKFHSQQSHDLIEQLEQARS